VVDWRDADALPGWDALARNAVEPNPFLEDWYLPALRAMGAGHVQLLCLEVEGALAGLMPLAASRRYYGRPLPHLAAWTHPNAFFGAPLVVRGMEPAFWQALLAYADARAGMGLFLHLAQMPLAGGLADALRDVLTQQRRPHGVVWREERAALASISPEAYLETSMSGKKRKELRRQHARLSELGVPTVERSRDDRGLTDWTEDFLKLERAGWKGGSGQRAAHANPVPPGLARRGRAVGSNGTASGRAAHRHAGQLPDPAHGFQLHHL
jgi:hypothetical protein